MKNMALQNQLLLLVLSVCLCHLGLSDLESEGFHMTLLHTSSFKAAFQQYNIQGGECTQDQWKAGECLGGVARLGTAIQDVRKEEDNVLLLDGGDQFLGEWFHYYKGNVSAYFMNELGYDAMAIGNLEFSLGADVLADFLEQLNFKAVSSNLDVTEEPALKDSFTNTVIRTIGGEQVGIVGFTTQKLSDIANIGNVNVIDPVEAVRQEVEQLTSQGINKIIALGHTFGWINDDNNEVMQIAKNVPDVDLIVVGGANNFLCNDCEYAEVDMIEGEAVHKSYPMEIAPNHDSTERVLVVNGYLNARYLGRLHVNFIDGKLTQWNGNPIRLDNKVVQDPVLLGEVNEFAERIDQQGNRLLGRTTVDLIGYAKGDQTCRRGECNLGNLVADAMLWEFRDYLAIPQWSDVQLAVMNAGGLRASIVEGDIRVRDVHQVLPFGNTFDAITIQGRYIWEMLEHSAAGYNEYLGGFLQVSGLRVTYNMSRTAYDRVVKVMVKCIDCTTDAYEPLNKGAEYKMAVPSFIRDGGDGYDMLKNAVEHRTGDPGDAVLAAYIQYASPISISRQGRIRLSSDERKHSTGMIALYVVIGLVALVLIVVIAFVIMKRGMRKAGSSSYLNMEQR